MPRRKSAEAKAASVKRLIVLESLEALRAYTLVVEAVVERLDVKRELFQQLEMLFRSSVIRLQGFFKRGLMSGFAIFIQFLKFIQSQLSER